MCLGIPGQITEKWIDSDSGLSMARVDFGGVGKEICLSFEPDAQMNDYVLVHVGFAISRIDESEAQQTLELLRQMGELEAELNVV
ncbi:HypC/HybG/HupF family hydrogenase formation chaperone [Chloroflexi bacterium TSY]|nr:HypC/HybG/HupF family hydrogenase formation chaperone [Chloroflexi bacterium TSY]